LTTVIDLPELEIPLEMTTREIHDFTDWYRVSYYDLMQMTHEKRKLFYQSLTNCLEIDED